MSLDLSPPRPEGRGPLLSQLLGVMLGERKIDDQLIEEGLVAESSRQRELALELAGRHVDLGAPHLLRAWARLPERREAIRAMLGEDPLLALERRPDRPLGQTSAAGPDVQRWFSQLRIDRLMGALAETPMALPDLLALCEGLPGLQQLCYADGSPLPEAVRAQLRADLQQKMVRRYPKQVSIIPSYYCDRSCPYCFNRAPHRSDLTLEKFKQILDTVAPAGDLTRVNLFGGEPTLFEGFFEFAEELDRRGLSFFFSTHGIIDNERFARIAALPRLEMVTLHVEKPPFYRPGEFEMLLRNARAVVRQKRQLIIRYNIVDAEHRDFAFLRPLFEEAPDAPFSFAVVFPSPNGKNRHAAMADLSGYAKKIVALVRWLDAEYPRIPRLVLSKPFPLCAFSDRDLRYLVRRLDYRNICEIDRRGFTDQIQVTPQLEVIACMAMGAQPYRLAELGSLEDMGRKLEQTVGPLRERPLMPACAQCSLFVGGACQAACFSYAAHADKPAAQTSAAAAPPSPRRLKIVT